jgi:hypothetical protein
MKNSGELQLNSIQLKGDTSGSIDLGDLSRFDGSKCNVLVMLVLCK